MRGPYTELYLHYVWATWDMLPIITHDVERRVYACIASKCREMKCEPLAIGGIEDHIHLLVSFPASVSPSVLVGEVKGASSHLVSHEIHPGTFFRWQGAYGAFTIGKSALPAVIAYIENQKTHHMKGSLVPEYH